MIGSLRMITRRTGTVWEDIYGEVIFNALLATLLLIIHLNWHQLKFKMISHQLLFIPVSFLLVFRCSNSYGRYWEGRGLLGQLTFNTREINTKCVCYTSDSILAENVRRLSLSCMYLITMTVKSYWDKTIDPEFIFDYSKVEKFLTEKEWIHLSKLTSGQPLFVLMLLRKHVADGCGRKSISSLQCFEMNQDISSLHTTWNAMMKITSTPLPYPWMHLTKVVLNLFVTSMIFPAVSVLGWVAIPFIIIIAFMLFGLAAIGHEMEDPFGDDVNDFDLATFESSVFVDVENLFQRDDQLHQPHQPHQPQQNQQRKEDPFDYRPLKDASQSPTLWHPEMTSSHI